MQEGNPFKNVNNSLKVGETDYIKDLDKIIKITDYK